MLFYIRDLSVLEFCYPTRPGTNPPRNQGSTVFFLMSHFYFFVLILPHFLSASFSTNSLSSTPWKAGEEQGYRAGSRGNPTHQKRMRQDQDFCVSCQVQMVGEPAGSRLDMLFISAAHRILCVCVCVTSTSVIFGAPEGK